MKNKLIFGFDIMTYNGPIPNCLHPKFLNTIYTASDFYFEDSGAFFSKRWNTDWPIYNSNFYTSYCQNKSVYEIKKDRENGIVYDWFYIIEPFANLDNFFGNASMHEFALNTMSKVAIDEIKNGNGKLFFNYIIDGGMGITIENFEKIIKFTKDNNIPDEKCYFIFQDFKLKKNFERLGMKYKVLDFNLALISKSQEFNNLIDNPDFKYWGENADEPQVGKIEGIKSSIASAKDFEQNMFDDKKDFLLLSRHWKLHRLLLLSQLHKLGLDKSLVSWDNKFYHPDCIKEMLMHDNNEEFAELVKNESRFLDVTDLTKIAGYGFETKDMYLNSYLSIVTESIFFQSKGEDDIFVQFPTGYLSEKVWKPIGHCHPFILVAPSKSLKYLKDRFGFKTFAPFIDESYDDESDDFARLRLIQAEIEKFSNKSKEEKIQFLLDVKDICIYNQKKFLEYGKDYSKEMEMALYFLQDFTKSMI